MRPRVATSVENTGIPSWLAQGPAGASVVSTEGHPEPATD